MQRNGWGQSKRTIAAFVVLGLAAGAVGIAGRASAIDLPEQLRKAAKGAPKGTAATKAAPLVKGAPLIKGAVLPKGVTLPNGVTLPGGVALPKGPTLPGGAALPNTALPNNAALPKGATLPNNAALPKGATLPNNAALPKGAALPNNAVLPKGAPLLGKGTPLAKDAALPKGAVLPKGAALPKSGPLGANQLRPTAAPSRSAALLQTGQRRDLSRLPAQDYRRLQIDHRQTILLARSRLPFRPLPGQRGFTGVPPIGETRFVTNEMVFHVGPNVSQQTIDAAARRLGLSSVASESYSITGGTLLHFRVADGRAVADVVRALEAENIGVAQPNYVFNLQQDAQQDAPQDTDLAARSTAGSPDQYVIDKLRLGEVHRVATGSNVLIAVIDSEIDSQHPDLAGAVVERFDAVGRPDKPDAHGTGMTGAIAARLKLMGVAPGARILAVHAFSPNSASSPQATTRHILAGLDWAIKKGARVINMSYAGPYDPMLALAMKNAREKGVVLIAASGNAGPKSPPLYPAADPNVIAVTATDANDQLFAQAVQGPHVAVAAPGVDILAPAPDGTYQVTTGTSVAAAHVSGVAALLMEHNPTLDPTAVFEILTMSAKNLSDKPVGAGGRDDKLGWGLVDPAQALLDSDAKVAQEIANGFEKVRGIPPAASTPVAAAPAAAKPAAARPAPTPASVR